MFPYWSAPPSLLRIWACPEAPDPTRDDQLHFRSLVTLAGEAFGALLIQAGCFVRAVLSSHAAETHLSGC